MKPTVCLFGLLALFACQEPRRSPMASSSSPLQEGSVPAVPAPATTADATRPPVPNDAFVSLPAAAAEDLSSFLPPDPKPADGAQSFQTGAARTTIRGRGGTTIEVDAGALETLSGKPVTGPIEVELRELFTPIDMLLAGAPTSSDGRQLVSGGSYYIGMRSGGEALRLRKGRSMRVSFPRITNDSMQLFYGERGANGMVNWRPAEERFVPSPWRPYYDCMNDPDEQEMPGEEFDSLPYNPDTFTLATWQKNRQHGMVVVSSMKEAEWYLRSAGGLDSTYQEDVPSRQRRLARAAYQAMEIRSLGWINCDRFLEVPQRTDLLVRTPPKTDIRGLKIYLVFREINSLMTVQEYHPGQGAFRFRGLPVGYRAKLIAYQVRNGELRAFSQPLKLRSGEDLEIRLRTVDQHELRRMLN